MSQSLRLFVVFVYTLLSVGVHVHAHECCCSSSVAISLTAEEDCCSSTATSCCATGCGTEQSFDFRLDQEHTAGEKLTIRNYPAVFSLPLRTTETMPEAAISIAPAESYQIPPPLRAKYELYCALITYG
ncbi:MAG: hypothetical protein ACK500_05770 [Flavobacteriales bacterium]|jgi:hypothetical protein